MKYDIQAKLYRISILLEILVGVSIAVAIGMSLIGLIADIHPIQLIADPDSLQGYLTTAMTIISPPLRRMKAWSPVAMPISTMSLITRGISSSKIASAAEQHTPTPIHLA